MNYKRQITENAMIDYCTPIEQVEKEIFEKYDDL